MSFGGSFASAGPVAGAEIGAWGFASADRWMPIFNEARYSARMATSSASGLFQLCDIGVMGCLRRRPGASDVPAPPGELRLDSLLCPLRRSWRHVALQRRAKAASLRPPDA